MHEPLGDAARHRLAMMPLDDVEHGSQIRTGTAAQPQDLNRVLDRRDVIAQLVRQDAQEVAHSLRFARCISGASRVRARLSGRTLDSISGWIACHTRVALKLHEA